MQRRQPWVKLTDEKSVEKRKSAGVGADQPGQVQLNAWDGGCCRRMGWIGRRAAGGEEDDGQGRVDGGCGSGGGLVGKSVLELSVNLGVR